jgi:hypothetical protein
MKDSTKFEIAELNKILAKLKKRSSQGRTKAPTSMSQKELLTKSRKQLTHNGVAEVNDGSKRGRRSA